jgi:hypothetical protein
MTKMTNDKPEPNAAKAKYEPTSEERTAIDKFDARKAASRAPRLKVLNKDVAQLSTDHPDQGIGFTLLMEALGTADQDFLNGLLGQLANASTRGSQIDERGLNFMVSLVKGIKPRDQIEAMLAAQMAAVHMATMTFAGRLAHVDKIPQQDSAERAFNKLARTFATQMEALKRYRNGGEQKVIVQHVSVSEGGQAIVGNVTQGPRETARDKAAAPPTLADSQLPAMKIVGEPASDAVPSKRKPSK